jgi:hypothetical protein
MRLRFNSVAVIGGHFLLKSTQFTDLKPGFLACHVAG